MLFEDAMKAMREGKKVQRKVWRNSSYRIKGALFDDRDNLQEGYTFMTEDIMADDWMVVPEQQEDDGA